MDAPNLPDSPTFPNRRLFAAGGLASGLLLGLIITALLEYRDTSMRNERDVWAFTKLPTLAVVSYINKLDRPSTGRKFWKRSARKTDSIESVRG
jgi:capsular polysaccharide biosynthesis protein